MTSRYVVETDWPLTDEFGDTEVFREYCAAGLASPNLRQSLIRVSGAGWSLETGEGEEVLFVAAGSGAATVAGRSLGLVPRCAIYVPPGCTYKVAASSDSHRLDVLRVRAPPPEGTRRDATEAHVRTLEDSEVRVATGGRDFQVMFDAGSGFTAGTMFVGNVPPGPSAPAHYHDYNEVIYVLEGEGILHIDGEHSPIGPGSCYRLPAGVIHQIENTGGTTLREVGVFVPSGSPAAAFLPDGTSVSPGQCDDVARWRCHRNRRGLNGTEARPPS